MLGMQRALSLLYPDQCALCPNFVDVAGGLCGTCWRDMAFIRGAACDLCGAVLPGGDDETSAICDDCMVMSRPWDQGRAAFCYEGSGRRFVLALKHGDRPDLAKIAGQWLVAAGRPVLSKNALVLPVPIHWSRTMSRRYNQSAELARALCGISGHSYCPDALIRRRRTVSQDGLGVDARFDNVASSIAPHPRRGHFLKGRDVCLIDDVMTSGATLSSATAACLAAGASRVSVLTLARVHKAP